MEQKNIDARHAAALKTLAQELRSVYADELISLLLYGSAASGDFVDKHSNFNLLAVLKNCAPEKIKLATKPLRSVKMASLLILSEEDIATSTDVFPVEFLDMQENYQLLDGKDILKDIRVDMRNLRFQCEHELKAKLFRLRHAYMVERDNGVLARLLLASFTSIVHILRNGLRIKDKAVPYSKRDALPFIAEEFAIDLPLWEKILAVREKHLRFKADTALIFAAFMRDLEKVVAVVDKW
jgi:hypothetical protein